MDTIETLERKTKLMTNEFYVKIDVKPLKEHEESNVKRLIISGGSKEQSKNEQPTTFAKSESESKSKSKILLPHGSLRSFDTPSNQFG